VNTGPPQKPGKTYGAEITDRAASPEWFTTWLMVPTRRVEAVPQGDHRER